MSAAHGRLEGAKVWPGGYAWTAKGARAYAARPGAKAKSATISQT